MFAKMVHMCLPGEILVNVGTQILDTTVSPAILRLPHTHFVPSLSIATQKNQTLIVASLSYQYVLEAYNIVLTVQMHRVLSHCINLKVSPGGVLPKASS